MKNDLISIDGRLVPFGESGFAPDSLLSSNFIYQTIHTFAHRPLHAHWAAEIAEMSCRALYGAPSGVTAELIAREAGALLRANGYPSAGSTLASLYLIPLGDAPPVRMMTCRKQLVYKGYTVTVGLECTVVPYDCPFPQHKTAVSLAAHTYAADYAERMGFGGAIAENAAGVMAGLGDNPLFAVAGKKILTPSMDDGAADSIERRLGIAVCEDAGFGVYEHPVSVADLRDFDELFALTPQGIVSIRQAGDRLFPHSLAKSLLPYLKKYQNIDVNDLQRK